MKEIRSEYIIIRVTLKEKLDLIKRASGNLSKYLRLLLKLK